MFSAVLVRVFSVGLYGVFSGVVDVVLDGVFNGIISFTF